MKFEVLIFASLQTQVACSMWTNYRDGGGLYLVSLDSYY